jgi:hypothetical protein
MNTPKTSKGRRNEFFLVSRQSDARATPPAAAQAWLRVTSDNNRPFDGRTRRLCTVKVQGAVQMGAQMTCRVRSANSSNAADRTAAGPSPIRTRRHISVDLPAGITVGAHQL